MAENMPYPQITVGNKNHSNVAVVIIGAGISGMCTAIDLIKRNNCRNFVILERSAGLGGTWYDNKYPGCCCDVFSTLYSYSFAQNSEWTREYPGQEEILAYLTRVAQEYKLYQHIRFNNSVEDATWDDVEKKWRTKVQVAKGSKEAQFSPEYEISSDFLISAVGQLNTPSMPKISGIESFDGKVMHSARWDWTYDVTDKKIALLGNGCTAVQILPEIAKVAKKVTVFQRTPNWVVPRLDAPVTPFMRNVLRYVPPVRWRKRAAAMDFRESTYSFISDSQSEMAIMSKDASIDMMHKQLPDQPELWEKLTPKYSIGCKRIIISDDYFPTISQPNVDLETRPIAKIDGRSITVAGSSGEAEVVESDYDLLVCATGFNSLDFMHPISMHGRGGRSLSDVWKGGARAFKGISVEDMPNFAMMYGPNTNLGHNSIILMIEAESRYVNGLIKPVLEARKQGKALSLSPRPDKIVAYNEKVQGVLKTSTFNDPNCNSWYKTEDGTIVSNWSGTVVDYQKMVSKVYYDEYEAEGSGKNIVRDTSVLDVGRVVEESKVSDRTFIALGVLSTIALAGSWLLKNPRALHALGVK